MVLEENWGVPIDRCHGFFRSQPDIEPQETGYRFQNCLITLKELEPGQMGNIPFPRTRLRVQGPEEEVSRIRRRFLVQFLTAGG